MENLIIVVVVAVAVIAGVIKGKKMLKGSGGCCSSSDYKVHKKKLDSVVDKKTFVVKGMMCQHCENRVMEAVNDISGASGVVDLKKGTVEVSMNHEIDDSVIKNAIERAGYPVLEIK